ncbi:MAG: hypothetical protein ABSB11_02425 [Sedimentisphaerales bacterium]
MFLKTHQSRIPTRDENPPDAKRQSRVRHAKGEPRSDMKRSGEPDVVSESRFGGSEIGRRIWRVNTNAEC